MKNLILDAIIAAGRELETAHDWSCFEDVLSTDKNTEDSVFVQVIYSHILPYVDTRKARWHRINELRKELAELENMND